ncbi:MAG: hypothetical protein E2591_26970 [Achromobacter sp.]|uniref:hypothetical protein n=1 Tax=Achromobacter sp. TaxID=134375 RepID=UPI0012D09DF3|nr:hypothetical protein [Achromobacter sp.]MPS81720.1 hypothetical protein [Achromobacter sp.]
MNHDHPRYPTRLTCLILSAITALASVGGFAYFLYESLRWQVALIATFACPWFFPAGAVASLIGLALYFLLFGATAHRIPGAGIRYLISVWCVLGPGIFTSFFLAGGLDYEPLPSSSSVRTFCSILFTAIPWLMIAGHWFDVSQAESSARRNALRATTEVHEG